MPHSAHHISYSHQPPPMGLLGHSLSAPFFYSFTDPQHKSTNLKSDFMQHEMRLLGVVREPIDAPMDLVRACKNRLDAIRLCVQLSGLTNEQIAQRLDIDKGHFTRIMQGRAYLDDRKSVHLMVLCGNIAPLQYEAMALRRTLIAVQGTSSLEERRKANMRTYYARRAEDKAA